MACACNANTRNTSSLSLLSHQPTEVWLYGVSAALSNNPTLVAGAINVFIADGSCGRLHPRSSTPPHVENARVFSNSVLFRCFLRQWFM